MNRIKTVACLNAQCVECDINNCPIEPEPLKPTKYIRVCRRCGFEVNKTYSAYSCKHCGLLLKSETKMITESKYRLYKHES